jgi:hypothetical protein
VPTVGVDQYNPDIMATVCRRPGCRGGSVGQRCRNAYGQDVAPHAIRKRHAEEGKKKDGHSTVDSAGRQGSNDAL